MAARVIWSCIICGTEAADRPPRKCPTCGVNAGKWRMQVDRAPAPTPEPAPSPKEEEPVETPEALAS